MTLAQRCSAALLAALFGLATVGCAHDTTVGQKIDDTTVTAKVKAALLADPDVKGTAVQVETLQGQVQLSGFVDSEAQARRAVDVASHVQGVDRVINKMSVKP
jgi:hyperosmotically inducible protein